MKVFTVRLDDELNQMLEMFMIKNKISSKNLAIKQMINYFVKNDNNIELCDEINRKLDRLLKLESGNKNLIEQLFSNHGFTMNLDKDNDRILKEDYKNNRKKYMIFID